MGEFSELFKHKKNLITLLLLVILILAVPIGINLIKNQQIFKSRAAGEPIVIKETLGVFQRNKPGGGTEWVAKKDAKISLELTSPLGPPAGTSDSPGASTPAVSYCPEAYVALPSLDQITDPASKVGKSEPRIELAYASQTNLSDPKIKAATDADIKRVTAVLNLIPVVGSPLVSLSSQDRYGYTFPAVNKESSGTYNKSINQLFLNMDIINEFDNNHVILHEIAHYLSFRQNANNLAPYLTQAFSDALLQAENKLLSCIRKYDQNPNMGAADNLIDKLDANNQVTWQEIVDAANVYPAQLWQDPRGFIQFREGSEIDMDAVKVRADDELYAEFSALLIRAQNKGLFDKSYQHPVYRIFSVIKR